MFSITTNKDIIQYTCNNCGKKFTRENNLQRHINVCKVEENVYTLRMLLQNVTKERDIYKQQIEEQKQTIRELQDKLENVAVTAVSQPRTINNQNNTQNTVVMNLTPFDINKEMFAEKIRDHFNKDYLMNGQKGVAKFVAEKVLKDEDGNLMYICTDPSRHIYRYKGINGSPERDVKGKN